MSVREEGEDNKGSKGKRKVCDMETCMSVREEGEGKKGGKGKGRSVTWRLVCQ